MTITRNDRITKKTWLYPPGLVGLVLIDENMCLSSRHYTPCLWFFLISNKHWPGRKAFGNQ